jgi:DNA-binding NtrC family response regulator
MVVEDDPLTRRLVANAFKQDYALITAATAQEAVMNYLIHAPDIVFLDIGLPDANGFNVLHQIMTSDPDAYVVMFSGNSYLDNVTNALSNGAAGFISKPFKKDKMFQYIQESSRHHHKYCA